MYEIKRLRGLQKYDFQLFDVSNIFISTNDAVFKLKIKWSRTQNDINMGINTLRETEGMEWR